jgi:GTP-binding protein
MLADLPGYGFAKVSKEEKKEWGELLEKFLATEDITLVLSLVDIRHDPTADDKMMVNYLYHYALPFVLVATKADKLGKTKVKPRIKEISADLRVGVSDITASSAETGLGKKEIFALIEQAIEAKKESKKFEAENQEE